MVDYKVKKYEEQGSREIALHFMQALVEVASECFVILNSHLRVLMANPTFYQVFQVSPGQTENKLLYELGNGQWNISALRNLLEEILPKKRVVMNFEVEHVFPVIGRKTILLNARQLDSVQLIILALEDITERKELERKLTAYANELEHKVAERTGELASRVDELERLNKTMVGRELKMMELKKEIERIKKMSKNGNGRHNGKKNGLPAGKAGNGNHRNAR